MHRPPGHVEFFEEVEIQFICTSRACIFRRAKLFEECNLPVDARGGYERYNEATNQELVFTRGASSRGAPGIERCAGPFVVGKAITTTTNLRRVTGTGYCAVSLGGDS